MESAKSNRQRFTLLHLRYPSGVGAFLGQLVFRMSASHPHRVLSTTTLNMNLVRNVARSPHASDELVVSDSLSSSNHPRTSEEFVGAVSSSGGVTRYYLAFFWRNSRLSSLCLYISPVCGHRKEFRDIVVIS